MQILDTSKDPYGRKYYAALRRREFEKLKRTAGFKHWKIRQLKIQKGRCAYCQVKLARQNIVTHIDHVQPLYYEGKNDLANLVLACRRCNVKKWISDKRVVPQWIKDNEQAYSDEQRLKVIRWKQQRQLEDLVTRELDEQLASDLSWIE